MIQRNIFTGLLIAVLALSSSYSNADVVDDFEGYTGVLNGGNGWNAKWDGGDATQRNLLSSQAGVGVGGTNGASLDAVLARHSYVGLNQTGVSAAVGAGNQLTLSSEFQITVDGNTPTQNNGLFGLHISEDPEWWNNSQGSNMDFTVARRGNATQQVLGVTGTAGGVGGFGINGWNNVNQFGLPGGADPIGTSDFFKMEVILTDNGTTYDASMTLYNSAGTAVTTISSATTFDSGATLYGGYNNGWNNVTEGDGSLSTVSQYAGVSEVFVDNFSFTGPPVAVPEPATASLVALGLLGLVGIRRRK